MDEDLGTEDHDRRAGTGDRNLETATGGGLDTGGLMRGDGVR